MATEPAGDAGRQRGRRAEAVGHHDLVAADQPTQLLGQRGRGIHVGLRQDEQELLAAVPADMSTVRRFVRRMSAIWRSIRSPAAWPCESFRRLKWSMSTITTDSWWPYRRRPVDLLLELGEDGLAVEHAGQLIDRGQRPDLGQPLGQLAEARAKMRVRDALRRSPGDGRPSPRRAGRAAWPSAWSGDGPRSTRTRPSRGARRRTPRPRRRRSTPPAAPVPRSQASGRSVLPG